MNFEQIKLKADELFSEASFIIGIRNDEEYQQALTQMDNLIEDYDKQPPLIEIFSNSIDPGKTSQRSLQNLIRESLNLMMLQP